MPSSDRRARDFFNAMNDRDFTGLELHLAPEVTFDFPGAGVIEGSRRTLAFLKVLFRKYERLVFTVDDVLCEGDRSCVVWTNEGEAAGGRPYRNRGVTLMRLSQDRIVYLSDYFKDTSFAGTI